MINTNYSSPDNNPPSPQTSYISSMSPNIKIQDNLVSPMSPLNYRKNYFQRTFGKMNEGSVRGSIFALCAVAIGSGVLSLPYVLVKTGCVLGIILILIGAFSGYVSMWMIIRRSIENNCKNFSELATLAGGKWLNVFLQISILSFMFGACVSY